MTSYVPAIVRNRRVRKAEAVLFFGNKCRQCGLENLPIDAFTFHHVNGEKFGQKGYKQPGLVLNLRHTETYEAERRKWAMLCMNCHNSHHGVGLTAEQVLNSL